MSPTSRMKNVTIRDVNLNRHRMLLPALVILVAAFSIFYPYLSVTGSCGEAGCPELAQAHASASVALPATGFAVVVAALAVALALTALGRSLLTSDRRPEEVYLSPDPRPPRL